MNPAQFRFYARRLVLAVAMLFGAAELWAQARSGTSTQRSGASAQRPGTSAQRPGTSAQRSGTGAAGRNYANATSAGEAMITSDLVTRRLIVITDDETAENIKSIIASLDKPKPQVLINVVFLQVTHNKDLDFGTEATHTGRIAIKTNPLGTATTNFGLASASVDPTIYGAFYKIMGRDVDAIIHALSATNKTEILSRPSILTRSSQQATIMVGQSVPIITNSRVSDQTNTTINTVQYQDLGIILRVTPFITPEGLVEMIVSPEISGLSAQTVPISNNVSSPVIDRRSADTVVVTPSDKTVVIGGLISTQTKDREDKVPLLGDIPLLGAAFKRKQKGDEKTELLIFLTPHVVQTPQDLPRLAVEEQAKLELAPKVFQKEDMAKYVEKQ
jgi:general secretion pathway protein D